MTEIEEMMKNSQNDFAQMIQTNQNHRYSATNATKTAANYKLSATNRKKRKTAKMTPVNQKPTTNDQWDREYYKFRHAFSVAFNVSTFTTNQQTKANFVSWRQELTLDQMITAVQQAAFDYFYPQDPTQRPFPKIADINYFLKRRTANGDPLDNFSPYIPPDETTTSEHEKLMAQMLSKKLASQGYRTY